MIFVYFIFSPLSCKTGSFHSRAELRTFSPLFLSPPCHWWVPQPRAAVWAVSATLKLFQVIPLHQKAALDGENSLWNKNESSGQLSWASLCKAGICFFSLTSGLISSKKKKKGIKADYWALPFIFKSFLPWGLVLIAQHLIVLYFYLQFSFFLIFFPQGSMQ